LGFASIQTAVAACRAKRGEDWSAAAATLSVLPVASQSGVVLRFPPPSKIRAHPWLKFRVFHVFRG
jgi:hypothetical protein